MRPGVVRAERESVGGTFANIQEHAVVAQCTDALIFSERSNFAPRVLEVDKRKDATVVCVGCGRTSCIRNNGAGSVGRCKCITLRETLSTRVGVPREEDRRI